MSVVISILHTIDTISDRVGKTLSWLLLALVFILVYAVVMRYIFNDPAIWAHETSLFIFGSVGVMIGAYVLRHKGHIRMDLFYNMLSPRKRAIVNCITAPFFFFLMVLLIWYGWELADWAIKTGKVTDSMWHPVLWPAKLALPIGCSLLLMQGTADFVRDLYLAVRGRSIE